MLLSDYIAHQLSDGVIIDVAQLRDSAIEAVGASENEVSMYLLRGLRRKALLLTPDGIKCANMAAPVA